MKDNNLQWGVVGLGKIAHAFVKDLQRVRGSTLHAAASRSQTKANEFARRFGVSKAYGDYKSLFEDKEVQIVYISTPHDSHKELAIAAMRAGKHVLCEKPLAINQEEVVELMEVAKKEEVFIMEAFWARFNPCINRIIELIRKGELGEVNYVNADFTFFREDAPESRMLNPSLAGGSLLDMGVYPIFLTYVALGIPQEIRAVGTLSESGVDLQAAATFKYHHAVAQVMSGFISQSDMRAKICGTRGTIILSPVWHETESFTFVDSRTRETTTHSHPKIGKGYTHEILECMSCIASGQKESSKWTLDDSLSIIRITDEIRKQLGVKYPME